MALQIRPPALTVLVFLALALSGCSHVLETSEMSPPLYRSPLRNVKPRTFAFKAFNDIRGAEDPTKLMKVGVHTFALEDPPADLAAQWIRQELERNGHRSVPYSPEVQADFLVEGTVFKFWLRQDTGWVSITETAETAVKLTITRVPADTRSLTKSYQGRAALTSGAIPTTHLWKAAIHQALMAMIQDLSFDPELAAFLAQ